MPFWERGGQLFISGIALWNSPSRSILATTELVFCEGPGVNHDTMVVLSCTGSDALLEAVGFFLVREVAFLEPSPLATSPFCCFALEDTLGALLGA